MPELTDDHIEDLFADLRAAEIQQVHPPGVAAAQTTVRRRRAVHSVAAGVAVLAVLGGIGLNFRGAPSHTTDSIIDGELVRLGETAKQAVDREFPGEAAAANSGPIPTVVRDVGSTVPGNYLLAMTCVGTGEVHVLVETLMSDGQGRIGKGTSSSVMTMDCADDDQPRVQDQRLRSDGRYTFTLTSYSGRAERTGFAWKLIDEAAVDDRWRTPAVPEAQRNALAAQAKAAVRAATPGGGVQLSTGMAIGVVDSVSTGEAPYGAGLIRIACAGDGALTVSVHNQSDAGLDDTSLGDELAVRWLRCSDDPTEIIAITIPFSYRTGTLAVVIDPNREALGRSGVAYSLTRA